MPRRLSLTDQIRRAIDESGESRYAIWKATGIDQAALSRFMAGKTGLSLDALDVLADHLRLTISTAKRPRPRGK